MREMSDAAAGKVTWLVVGSLAGASVMATSIPQGDWSLAAVGLAMLAFCSVEHYHVHGSVWPMLRDDLVALQWVSFMIALIPVLFLRFSLAGLRITAYLLLPIPILQVPLSLMYRWRGLANPFSNFLASRRLRRSNKPPTI